jgi:hypothetical protein
VTAFWDGAVVVNTRVQLARPRRRGGGMRDTLTLVERYFVEELNSHYGESLAREWLTNQQRLKISRALQSLQRQGHCGLSKSQSGLCLQSLRLQSVAGQPQEPRLMRRSHSETDLQTAAP